jgi:hypothetical protein
VDCTISIRFVCNVPGDLRHHQHRGAPQEGAPPMVIVHMTDGVSTGEEVLGELSCSSSADRGEAEMFYQIPGDRVVFQFDQRTTQSNAPF